MPKDDLIDRLSSAAEVIPHEQYSWLNPLLAEAVDEIAKLRAEIAALTHAVPNNDRG